MLLFGITALLGIAQPAPFPGACTEGEARIHIPGVDVMARVVAEDGTPVQQSATVRFNAEGGPFVILIGYPEPGARPDWVQVYFFAGDVPVRPDETLRLIAPDGQHWDAKARGTGVSASSGRKGPATEFVFLSPDQPNSELARQIAGSEAFNIEQYRDGAVQAGMSFHPLPRDMRTLLHQKAIDQASAAMKPCASATTPPQSVP